MSVEVFLIVTPNCLTSGGKHGLGRLDAVLDVDRADVLRIADVEGRDDGRDAVAGAVGVEVDHPLDAVDLLLDRRGDRLGDRLGIGAGVGRRDLDLGRRDLGILRDRQDEDADAADQQHEQGQHGREDRPPDEEVDHARLYLAFAGRVRRGRPGLGLRIGAASRGGSALSGAGSAAAPGRASPACRCCPESCRGAGRSGC